MKKRILMVDDEPALTRMVKLNLERTGNYEVRTENQGSKAIAAAKEFKPDLIFLDVMMPDMSGDEVAAQLKEDAQLASIKHRWQYLSCQAG
jgi:CheY-like chemotaxis protein